jgi:pimeloyl-ACP methyl ester carboxylesterase
MGQANEHFMTSRDGTRIWWSSAGTGKPAAVLTDGVGCAGYIWRYLEPALARTRRVIRWNYRGHGRSEAPADPSRVTLLDAVDDLLEVLTAAAEERVVLFGHSMGVQVSLEAHRRAPERVAALVLVCGSSGRALETFHDSPLLKATFPFARRAVERFPELARLAFRAVVPTEAALQLAMAFEVNPRLAPREDLVRYLEDLADVDPALFVRTLASAQEHDAFDHLPHVQVPTLVVAGERDSFTPMWLSVRMHAAIPGSELLVLPAGTHVGPLEHPELLGLRVEKFLRDHRLDARPAPRTTAGRRRRAGGRGEP